MGEVVRLPAHRVATLKDSEVLELLAGLRELLTNTSFVLFDEVPMSDPVYRVKLGNALANAADALGEVCAQLDPLAQGGI